MLLKKFQIEFSNNWHCFASGKHVHDIQDISTNSSFKTYQKRTDRK